MASADNGPGGLAGRIKRLRQRVQRREKQTRAKRRASSRRVRKRQPKTTGEKAKVAKEEASDLASDAKQLVATELGVSKSESGGVIREATKLIESSDKGTFDFDGDGDTDVLNFFDQEQERRQERGLIEQTETPVEELAEEPMAVAPDLSEVSEPMAEEDPLF